MGLDDNELQKIAALPSCRQEVYKVGETISSQGQVAQNLYVLDQGKVNLVVNLPVTPSRSARQVVVDTVTRGGIFDWSALVPPHILTRSVVCAEPTRVLSINGAELLHLMESAPHIGYQVMKGLVHIIGWRLREAQRVLASREEKPRAKGIV